MRKHAYRMWWCMALIERLRHPWYGIVDPGCAACRRDWTARIPALGGGSNWEVFRGGNILDDIGTVTASSQFTTLTANGTANVKGTTFTQLIASTTRPYGGLVVFTRNLNATAARALMDIAIGAAASEVVLLPDILSWKSDTSVNRTWNYFYFPIAIPSGVRLSMRMQSSTGSWTLDVGCFGMPVNMLLPVSFSRCTAYGVDTSDSGGTAIDSGATANTKGAYAVLSASTANAMKAMVPVVTGSNFTVPATAATVLVDVSIGAAADEQPIVSNAPYNRASIVSSERGRSLAPLAVNIPAATRLTARCQASGTDANARLQDVVVYGFD